MALHSVPGSPDDYPDGETPDWQIIQQQSALDAYNFLNGHRLSYENDDPRLKFVSRRISQILGQLP